MTKNIQSTGRKTNLVSKYLEEIQKACTKSQIAGTELGGRNFKQIRRAIKKDCKLNHDDKQALESEIAHKIKECKEPAVVQTAPIIQPGYRSLSDAIKNLRDE